MADEEYLGDGLYVSFDGFMFTLRAPRHDCDHWVGLEPQVLKNFDLYRTKMLQRDENMFFFEVTKAGTINWKMECDRANRLLAQCEQRLEAERKK